MYGVVVLYVETFYVVGVLYVVDIMYVRVMRAAMVGVNSGGRQRALSSLYTSCPGYCGGRWAPGRRRALF